LGIRNPYQSRNVRFGYGDSGTVDKAVLTRRRAVWMNTPIEHGNRNGALGMR
jgi:hypothetical protein